MTPSTSSNEGLLIVLALVSVLVVFGIVVFAAIKRRAQVATVALIQQPSPVPPQADYRPNSYPDGATAQFAPPAIVPWAALPQTPQPVEQIQAVHVAIPLMENCIQSKSTTVTSLDAPAIQTPPPVLASPTPEMVEHEVLNEFAQAVTSPRIFAVPRRPTMLSQKVRSDSLVDMYTWLAPCGHTNMPGVRFCRVCGQIMQQTLRVETK